MFTDSVADYFEGVAAKYLSAVDARPEKSNQHEIGGLVQIGFKNHLGEPARGEVTRFPAHLVYLSDKDEELLACDDELTWYGASRRDPTRRLEYRLYYKSNPVTARIDEGDFFLIGKRTDGSLLLVFCPPESSIEAQLRSVFGLDEVGEKFRLGKVSTSHLVLPVRLLLEELGLVTAEKEVESNVWLDELITRFGGVDFPQTLALSTLARETAPFEVDPVGDPDGALMGWMDHEEFLFRTYERHVVQQRLRDGFGADGSDVDGFIAYSLSVQNRRKSRVGHSFEGHIDALFKANKLQFERPRGKGRVTENNSKPDFIFPSFACYHDLGYPADQLVILGAKTTCKDRWRQVLAEAHRIERKHLITLEPAISSTQTDEMASSALQLVVPQGIFTTYTQEQQGWLQSVRAFIAEVCAKQKRSIG